MPSHPARLAALVFLVAHAASAEEPARGTPGPWELVKTTDGITVKRRKLAGFSLQEFQGRAVLDVPLARLLAAMDDDEHRPEWSAQCAESRIIATLTESEVILYDRTKGSWPVSDRDVVLHATTVIDPAHHEVRIDFKNVEDARQPPVKGVVRMPLLVGHWILRPLPGGATDVEYQVHADPGGGIPDWLSNLVSKALPRKTLQGLREQAKKPRYEAFAEKVSARPEYRALMEGLN